MASYRTLRVCARAVPRLPAALLRSAVLRLRETFVTIPMRQVSNNYAFSFGEEGWHYFRDILVTRQRDKSVPLEQSAFFQFFTHPRTREVRLMTDVLFLADPVKREMAGEYQFFLGTYPWGEWSACDDISGGDPFGHYYDRLHGTSTRDRDGYRRNPWYEPGDVHPLEIEWRQALEVCDSLRTWGYTPALFGSWPEVVLLERADGRQRAVVAQGQHRVVAMSHLGHRLLTAMVTRDSMQVIRETDVRRWHHVRSGRCPAEVALAIFHAFFDLNGRERAKELDVPVSY